MNSHPADPTGQKSIASMLSDAQPVLFRYIYALTFNSEVAWDLLQQTNLTILESAEQFKPGTNFMAWATTIAHYRILTWRNERSRSKTVPGDELFPLMDSTLTGRPGYFREYAEQSSGKDILQALNHCLGTLSLHYRKTLEDRYQHGLSVKEIARQAGKSENAVSQLIVRIKTLLSECISRQVSTTRD